MALTNANKTFIRKNYKRLSSRQLADRIQTEKSEVQSYIRTLTPQFDARRERQFKLFALSFPLVLFVMLELVLRLFNYGGNLDLFITASGDYADYYSCNPHVGKRYFFMQETVPDPPNDLFLKQKPANGYRIFVVGGSTTAGYPYGNNLLFSRILQQRLKDVFPQRHIEVVNTAMTAINTYTIFDFLPEILERQTRCGFNLQRA